MYPAAIELAAALNGVLPGVHWRAFFASDAFRAVEAGLKIAVQYWHNLQPRRQRSA